MCRIWKVYTTAVIACFVWTAGLRAAAPEYRAGVAAVEITPREPIRLSGYGNRSKPSEGVLMPIHTKALAIAHGRGERLVIITTDLIGLPRAITDMAAARLQQKYELDRASILFNSSHTHTGPYVRGNLPLLFDIPPGDKAVIDAYAERLTDALVEVAGRALLDLSPATLAVGHGEARIGINRRQATEKGVIIGLNPGGASDPDVPVLRVTGADGKVRAILFGFACHNTTLTGEHNQISGDYAGYAQEALERANPGVTAMFVMLCGADQNPNPRGTTELVKQHGETMAREVTRVLGQPMTPVRGAIKTAFRVTELEFQENDRDTFEARLQDRNASRVRHAKAMLQRIDTGQQIRRYPYPVQAVSFGGKFTLVALGGEVVVDYALRIKREYPGRDVVVAGYSNDVMAYIPSLRVTREGGYEVLDSMYYYGLPAPWAENTEERIMGTVGSVMKAVR